jgi:hypothetical protein
VYRAFATREPNSEFSPGLSQQAIEAYRKGGFTQLVLEGKREYVALYNYGTTFWQGRNKADYPNIARELKLNLKDVATYFHANAQKSKKADEYLEAGALVSHLPRVLPGRPGVVRHQLSTFETLYAANDFRGASRSSRRPRTTTRAIRVRPTAAYAALESYGKYEAALPAAEKAEAHKVAVDAGVKFGTSFPEHPDSAGVLTRAAEDIFASAGPAARHRGVEPGAGAPAAGRPGQAAHRVHHHRPVELRPDEFPGSGEGLHRRRVTCCRPNDKMRADLTERIASSCTARPKPSRSRATPQARSKTSCASRRWRALQDRLAGRIRCRRDAGESQGLAARHPGTRALPLQQPEERVHGRRHQEAGRGLRRDRPGRAGRRRVRAHRDESGGVQGHPARGQPAGGRPVCQGRQHAQGRGHAREVRGHVPDAGGRFDRGAAEARRHRRHLGELDKQRYWQREIVNADRTAGAGRTDRTQYLAAKSQLALASPTRDEFRDIALVLPLKASLAKKKKAMEAALGAYKSATDYRVAEVTTLATYEIAEIYRKLGQDIMKSERPKKLAAEQLDEYNSLLEEQAFRSKSRRSRRTRSIPRGHAMACTTRA